MKKKAFKAAFPYTLPICVGFLFLGMCDESFTVNCTVDPPEGVDRGWYMFWVNALNQFYWVTGATAGALLGYVIHFNTTGIAGGSGNDDDTFSAVHYLSGRKKATGSDHVSWHGAALCGDWIAGCVLFKGRSGKWSLWALTAGNEALAMSHLSMSSMDERMSFFSLGIIAIFL